MAFYWVLSKLLSMKNLKHIMLDIKKTAPVQESIFKYVVILYAVKCSCFAITLKSNDLKRLLRTYKVEGLVLPRHKNCGKLPHNAKSLAYFQKVAQFIKNYAEDHALFMPGRVGPQYKLCKLLPSSETKSKIYEKYKECLELEENDNDDLAVSIGLFKYVWRTCCPDVIICRPRSTKISKIVI